jgi:hypothetical protein
MYGNRRGVNRTSVEADRGEMPRDATTIGLVGVAASAGTLAAGLRLYRRRFELKGWLGSGLVLLGVLGLAVSVGWLLLGAYIDAHVS